MNLSVEEKVELELKQAFETYKAYVSKELEEKGFVLEQDALNYLKYCKEQRKNSSLRTAIDSEDYVHAINRMLFEQLEGIDFCSVEEKDLLYVGDLIYPVAVEKYKGDIKKINVARVKRRFLATNPDYLTVFFKPKYRQQFNNYMQKRDVLSGKW